MAQASPGILPPDLAAWIGRESRRVDTITPRLEAAFRATLAPNLALSSQAPLGVFWCLAPDIVGPDEIGQDGHPRLGLFIPAMPYPRRMWAGGELIFHGDFAVGDVVTKTSTIADIAFKTGGTGRLAFLTVRHRYDVAGRLVLDERQDVVYRESAENQSQSRPAAVVEIAETPAQHWVCTPDPVTLFRYSALTFNGHRIHYDQPYATGVEGYPDLVVHGPLQATWMLNLAAQIGDGIPRRFAYRGRAPLACGTPVQIEARTADRGLALRVVDERGVVTMTAAAALDHGQPIGS